MPVRVLLLDDDLVFASEARTAFLAAGCEVEVLDDGSAAVLRASQQTPDVVIASAELPGINGFRLCTRLKKAHEKLAVVLTFSDVSASGVASHQKLVSHADAYIPRTVAIHELVTRVRSLTKRARSDSPASSRRKTGAPSSRPRSRTPAKGIPAARSVRPSPGTSRSLQHPPMAPPPVPGRVGAAAGAGPGAGVAGGAPRPELGGSGQAERDKLRKDLDAAKAERDELSRTLQAAKTDAEALRRALDQTRAEIVKVQSEATAKARAAAAAEGEAGVLGAALADVTRDRDERVKELEASRARIARLEQQIAEVEAKVPPPSERLDQRLAVMQRAADAARLEREEARREADAQRARAVELDGQLRKEQLARAEAEAKRELAIEQAELGMSDPSTVEGRVQDAMDLARREHALEMTRQRGEHAAVIFQLRHELAVLRGNARASIVKPTPPQGTAQVARGADLPGDLSERAQAEAIVVLKERHAKELEATRANLGVMMRRVEALEAQREASSSGEHPVAAAVRPAPPPVPARKTR
jgi:DNA-binding NarL/FixJ family response regulator